MWSALTTAIARDLSEFASVVGSDAAQMVHAAASGAGGATVVTGDTDFPEVASWLGDGRNVNSNGGSGSSGVVADEDEDEATSAAFLALQEDLDTFRLPLSEEEQQQFTRWANYERAMDRDRWRMLLTESAEIQEAFEECVEGDDPCCTDDEFFSRYFWRLSQLRMSLAIKKATAVDSRKTMVGSSAAAAGGSVDRRRYAGGLDGWDDDSEETSVLGGGSAAFSAVEAQRAKRLRDLEKLVETLQAQVAALTEENHQLRRQQQLHPLPDRQSDVLSVRPAEETAPQNAVGPALGSAADMSDRSGDAPPQATTAACAPPNDEDDDDDWTKLT